MNDTVQEIAEQVRRHMDVLEKITLEGDWVDAWTEGDAIGTDEAAFISGCSTQTVRRMAASAALTGNPIGRQMSKSVWLISRRRLLDWMERHNGLPARVKAKARAEKWKMDAQRQTSTPFESAATG